MININIIKININNNTKLTSCACLVLLPKLTSTPHLTHGRLPALSDTQIVYIYIFKLQKSDGR